MLRAHCTSTPTQFTAAPTYFSRTHLGSKTSPAKCYGPVSMQMFCTIFLGKAEDGAKGSKIRARATKPDK